MKLFHKTIFFLLLLISIVSCDRKKKIYPDPLSAHLDKTVNPSDNFFLYANGGWFKNNPISSAEKGNGIFRTIQDTINSQIKSICETAARAKADKGSNQQKIGDFFTSGMDSVQIDKNGFSPLKEEFATIDTIKNLGGLLKKISQLHTIGVEAGFGFEVAQDDKISSKNAVILYQGGLGLEDRDYYLNTDVENQNIRKEYELHIKKMMLLVGEHPEVAAKKSAAVMKLETQLAKSSRNLDALRDPLKNYNKLSISQLNKLVPNINWNSTFKDLGVSKVDSLIVGQPEFYRELNGMLKSYSIEDWKAYLKWGVLNNYASYLSKDIETENFHFNSTVMNGIRQQKPRWKRVVKQTDNSLGELIGQIYVKEYLPKGSKEKLLEIGNNIRHVFAMRIKKLDWMSETTKGKALNKLGKIVMKVGYPDKWKDMSSIIIDKSSYCSNVMAIRKWEFKFMVNKYGKPVDRNEWSFDPQTYNAYYKRSNNEICVPACNILVPGFEGRMPDDAVLYGIIGSAIFGHEITHGFDDNGSKYDGNGNLNNWWTNEDLKKFQAKTKLIVSQYNKFKVGNKNVNGDATQSENIADLGGVIMGYEAFKKTDQYKNREIISGLNPEKRYFLAYAYSKMVHLTKEALMQQLMTDVHAPVEFRINGPLANLPEFYKAFNIKRNTPMRQIDRLRVQIW